MNEIFNIQPVPYSMLKVNSMKVDFMKKIKLIYSQLLFKALFLFFLFECSSVEKSIPENLRNFALDVSRHPEKIKNLKFYYPEFYNPDCYYKRMQDTNITNETINYINLDFNSEDVKIHYELCGTGRVYFEDVKKNGFCNCKIDSSNVSIVYLIKERFIIQFEFIKCDSMYKIFNIQPVPYSM